MDVQRSSAPYAVPLRKLFSLSILLAVFQCAPVLAADGQLSLASGDAPPAIGAAPPPAPGCDGGGPPRFPLSDEQLEKLNALRLQTMSATAAPRAQLQVLRAQLQDLLSKPAVDRAAATALQVKINGLRDDLSLKKLNFRLDEASLMSSDQRQEMRHHLLLHKFLRRMKHHGGPDCS